MRKRAPRSRNGCSNCKDRRLKCDETRPACQQCQRRDKICPGYQQSMRWSDKYEMFGVVHESTPGRKQRDLQPRTSSPPPQSNGQQPSRLQSLINATPDVHTGDSTRVNTMTDHESIHSLPDVQRTLHDPSNTYGQGLECSLGSGITFSISQHDTPLFMSDEYSGRELLDMDFWNSLNLPWFTSPTFDAQAGFERQGELFVPPAESAPAYPSPLNSEHEVDGSHRTVSASKPSVSLSAEPSQEETSLLLEHYFTNIVPIYSVFDSLDNPFRYLVSRYIDSSPLIRNCVLKMSAMHRMQGDEDLQKKVIRYHSAALRCLSIAIGNLELDHPRDDEHQRGRRKESFQEALFALLLFGNSSSWLDPSDIGVTHLFSARTVFKKWVELLRETLNDDLSRAAHDRDASFIIGAMAYWEATIAFVVDQPLDAVEYLMPFCSSIDNGFVYPNPWTGLSTSIFIVMARVAICARQRRALSKTLTLGWSQDIYDAILKDMIQHAKGIEILALEYMTPHRATIQGLQHDDQKSVLSDLESMAYTYKLTALLELYRCFPELGRSDYTISTSLMIDTPIFAQSTNLSSTSDALVTIEHQKLIYDMAINLLGQLRETANRAALSGLNLAHTLALLIGGSALVQFPCSSQSSHSQGFQTKVTNLLANINRQTHVVEGWRSFVRQRLRCNAEFVGLASFSRVETLLEEVWQRLDDSAEVTSDEVNEQERRRKGGMHWLDVMEECRLETVFG